MKFRKGFVTNSSSSSFILAYNEDMLEKNIWNQLKENYDYEKAGEYFGYLMHYIDKEENMKDNKNFLENIKKLYFYPCKWEVEEELEKSGLDIDKIYDYMHSNEGELKVKERVQQKVDKLFASFENCDTIKKIKISDDYEPLSSLEYYVVKNLKECKAKISHH